jgi:hypothetical protein
MPRRFPVEDESGGPLDPIVVPDLFEIPVPWRDDHLLKTWISVPDAVTCDWAPVHQSVFCAPGAPDDAARFDQFCNGRSDVYRFSRHHDEAEELVIMTLTLGNYSYFVYLAEERRRELVELMKRVRPKPAYTTAADRIAASLGKFNSKAKISRAASITGEEIVANLATRMERDEPLVVCTDGSSTEEIFDPIRNHFAEVIFLDRYLREDGTARGAVGQLPRYDEAVDALLTQLVASKARVFAGTLFSTFTGLIHRMRGFADPAAESLYCYSDFDAPHVRFERCEFLPVEDGEYTWNRVRYPVSPDGYSWMREWPEAWA